VAGGLTVAPFIDGMGGPWWSSGIRWVSLFGDHEPTWALAASPS
jgi:hypothetical protein